MLSQSSVYFVDTCLNAQINNRKHVNVKPAIQQWQCWLPLQYERLWCVIASRCPELALQYL